MDTILPKGCYVLAVSGGVDSMVLLDILAKKTGIKVIVAHFNHGIRPDSAEDESLVVLAAAKYGLQLEVGYGNLGVGASEDLARRVRYEFLKKVSKKYNATAIITAHHQDDYIETAFINLLRGTKRRGIVSIAKNLNVIRPLLKYTKKDILKYANANKLRWHEDTSNSESKYLRNYIRKHIIPDLTAKDRDKFLNNLDKVAVIYDETEYLLATISHKLINRTSIHRSRFAALPYIVANEIVAYWLRTSGLGQFDQKTIERLSLAIKTSQPGSTRDIYKGKQLLIGAKRAKIIP